MPRGEKPFNSQDFSALMACEVEAGPLSSGEPKAFHGQAEIPRKVTKQDETSGRSCGAGARRRGDRAAGAAGAAAPRLWRGRRFHLAAARLAVVAGGARRPR